MRRYFIGLMGFAFVACWAAIGLLDAIAAAAVCAALVFGPALVAKRNTVERHRPARPRPPRTEAYDLVPDEPSLIVELSSLG